MDREGKWLLTANYGSGGIGIFPVRADGGIGEAAKVDQYQGKSVNEKRQAGPHAHCFDFDPSGKWALACDLGTDRIHIYKVGTWEEVAPGNVKPGSGPRHVAWGKDGKFVYVINEMGCTVTTFAWDAAKGTMTEVETVSTVPADYRQSEKDTGAEIMVHPSGKWAYASTRGHDSIVKYDVDATSGKLSNPAWAPSGGKVPRYFEIIGDQLVAANQGGDEVVVFEIKATGELKEKRSNQMIKGVTCVKFLTNE
jgi:6-phosphogluconolactonase